MTINLITTTSRKVSQKLCLAHGNTRYCAWPHAFKQSSVTSSEEVLCQSKYRVDNVSVRYSTKNNVKVAFFTVPT